MMNTTTRTATREELVPLAEAIADVRFPRPDTKNVYELRRWSKHWDAEFHRAMARLVSMDLPVPAEVGR